MDQVYLDVLELLGDAVCQRRSTLRRDMDFRRIVVECQRQFCAMPVMEGVLTAENGAYCPLQSQFRLVLIQNAAREMQKRTRAEKLLRDLVESGLSPILLKGEQLAQLYPNPLLREYSDTDLYFPERQRQLDAFERLRALGGKPYETESWKHISVDFPEAGRFELHNTLFDPVRQSGQLHGETLPNEPPTRFRLPNGTETLTLGCTDGLKYIFLHFWKHFLFSQYTLRQMTDLLLYVRTYRDDVDRAEWDRFLRAVGAKKLFDVVIGVGVEFLGFEKDALFDADYSADVVRLFLEDCFRGGVQGGLADADGIRGVGAASYAMLDSPRARALLLRDQLRGVLFPKRQTLEKHFPVCRNRRAALPLAWAQNLTAVARGAVAARQRLRRRASLVRRLDCDGKRPD